MPQLSAFYGIRILMSFGDHDPPHFHARYGSDHARVGLDGSLVDGSLPRRARRPVREWAELHADELAACWERATHNQSPGTFQPLP